MVRGDDDGVALPEQGRRQRDGLELEAGILAVPDDVRDVRVVVVDLGPLLLEERDDLQGRRLARVVDVLLVGEPEDEDLGALDRLPPLVQGLDRLLTT